MGHNRFIRYSKTPGDFFPVLKTSMSATKTMSAGISIITSPGKIVGCTRWRRRHACSSALGLLRAAAQRTSRTKFQCYAVDVTQLENLLTSCAQPVLKVAVVCSVGAFCAKKGLLNLDGRRALSKLAFCIFTPALLMSKLAVNVNVSEALELWPLGLNVALGQGAGMALGYLITGLLTLPPTMRKVVVASCALSNCGNLPLVLAMSIIQDPSLPFMGPAETQHAITYVMLSWFWAAILHFPMAYMFLKRDDEEPTREYNPGPVMAVGNNIVPLGSRDLDHQHRRRSAMVSPDVAMAASRLGHRVLAAAVASRDDAMSMDAVPSLNDENPTKSPVPFYWRSSTSQSLTKVDLGGVPHPVLQQLGAVTAQWASSVPTDIRDKLHDRLYRLGKQLGRSPILEGILTPPTLACVLGVLLGSVPEVRSAVFSSGGSLAVLGESIDMLGMPSIPLVLLVLGANLGNGPGPGHVPWPAIWGVLAARLVVSPLLGAGTILLLHHMGFLQMNDPLMMLVMITMWSTPTAITVHAIASVHANGEDEVSTLLFWEYLMALVTLPVVLAVTLYLLGCCTALTA